MKTEEFLLKNFLSKVLQPPQLYKLLSLKMFPALLMFHLYSVARAEQGNLQVKKDQCGFLLGAMTFDNLYWETVSAFLRLPTKPEHMIAFIGWLLNHSFCKIIII